MSTVNLERINSAGITAEMRDLGLTEIEFLGSFDPLEPLLNVCEADAKIRLYRFPSGYMVADTNGDPVWEAQDLSAWADLMADYGIDL